MNNAERFWNKVDKTGECWEWTGTKNKDGYGMIKLHTKKMVSAHRLSYVLHHPLNVDIWEYREICVCHKCDNPKCVNPSHLFLGSRTDNMTDMFNKGRCILGEKKHNSKLTDTQVREIRTRYADGGITHRGLAKEYGTSSPNITAILNRKLWKHI
jgi:hypothetical protein